MMNTNQKASIQRALVQRALVQRALVQRALVQRANNQRIINQRIINQRIINQRALMNNATLQPVEPVEPVYFVSNSDKEIVCTRIYNREITETKYVPLAIPENVSEIVCRQIN